MISTKLGDALNAQLNFEQSSSFLYLSMAAHLQSKGLQGFANWMKIQVQEENFHADRYYNYIIERGAKVELGEIEKPKTTWNSLLEIFEDTLEHEQKITKATNELMDKAIEEKDHAAVTFLQWFINEQVEEEANAEDALNKVRLIGENGNAIYILDQEFAKRVFVAPTNA